MIKRFTKFRSNITMCLSFPPPTFRPLSLLFLHSLFLSRLPSLSVSITLSLPLTFPLSPSLYRLGRSPHHSRSHSLSLSVSHALCLSASRLVSPSVSPFIFLYQSLCSLLSLSSLPSYASLSPSLSLGLSLSVPSSHRLNPYLLVAYPASR